MTRRTKSILVTGGLGYIGSHTVVELVNAGYDVMILDNLSNSKREVHQQLEALTNTKIKLYLADVTSYEEVSSIFNNHTIDGVIHFAAYKAVGESVEKPLMYYRNNVGGMVNLLQCMHQYKCSSLVFSSSCTVYGQPTNLPVTEASPVVKAESPYGNTKKICEEILQDTANATNIKGVSLRYFNPVGAHSSSKIGELPLGVPNNLMPFITQTAAGWRNKLTIFGSDYNTPDGSCIRDYIHVEDLAAAHLSALEYCINMDRETSFFNVGTGKGLSVLEIIEGFERYTGVKLPVVHGPRRPGDIEKIWADTDKVTKELGWVPQKTLEDMVVSAWNWQKTLKKEGD